MKKAFVNKIILPLLIIVTFVFILGGCVTNNNNIELADYSVTFEEDVTYLQRVTDYLSEFDYTFITVEKNKMIVDTGIRIPIDNDEIKTVVSDLFNRGYHRISKSYDVIEFHRWDKVLHPRFSAGFAYTLNDTVNLDYTPFIIYHEPLSVSNWYYYEEDYNEYRLHN